MRTIYRGLSVLLALCLILTGCASALAEEGVITLPGSLTVVSEEAFYGVMAVDSVVVPEGVTEICSGAFAESSLWEITLPDSLEVIADDAFDGTELIKVKASEESYAAAWARDKEIPVDTGITRLTWVVGSSPAPADNDMVLAALNEIAREKLGVEVDIIYMSNDEVAASIAEGEVYDMYFSGSWFNNYAENAKNGVYAELSASLLEYAPELYATMPDSVWGLARSEDGGLYGIPIKKDYAPMYFVVYDAAIAREAGIEIPDYIESLDELTEYLVALKEAVADEGTYPVGNYGIYGLDAGFEYIDRSTLIGVTPGETQVHFLLEEENILDRYRTMYKWNDMGLVGDIDAYTQGSHAISFVQAWTGYDYSPSRGFEAKMTQFSDPFLTMDGVQGGMTAFNITLTDDPERLEKALQFQELVNTDQEVRDILAYGVPGYHFNYRDVTDEDGEVTGQVVVRTLEGNNYRPWQFAQASYQVKTVEASEQALDGTYPPPVTDQWEQYFAVVDEAPASQLGGFQFDSSELQEEIKAISAIQNEYMPDLQAGRLNPDETVLEMRQRMNEAGLQTVITEVQRQLDAFLLNKVAP